MESAREVIETFWEALARRDVPRARSFLAARAAFHVAGAGGRGGAGFGLGLAALMLGARAPLRILATSSSHVVVERHVRLDGAVQRRPHLVLALVQVRGGRISRWIEFHDSRLVVEDGHSSEAASRGRGAPPLLHAPDDRG